MLPTDGNEQLLDAEREWLEHQIELVFAPDFKEGEDYEMPFQWAGARSRTIMLQSEKAIEAFPLLVKKIQTVLSHARNDWIIYFQSEGEEFIVWLCADKIVITPEFEKNVRNLLQSR